MLLRLSCLLFLILLLALGAMQLPAVKEFAINKGNRLFTEYTALRLEFEEVELVLPFEIKLTKPKLYALDGQERFAADSLVARFNPFALISKKLHIYSLTLDNPQVHKSEAKAELPSLPPFPIAVDQLLVNSIEAKVDYDPNHGYLIVSGKRDDTKAHITFSADDDIGFMTFEGSLDGKHVSGSLTGSYKDWEQCFQDYTAFANYQLDGKMQASWGDGEGTSVLKIGNGDILRLVDLEVKTPQFNARSDLTLGAKEASGTVQIQDTKVQFAVSGSWTGDDGAADLKLSFDEGDVDAKVSYIAGELGITLFSEKFKMLSDIDLSLLGKEFEARFKYLENHFSLSGTYEDGALLIREFQGQVHDSRIDADIDGTAKFFIADGLQGEMQLNIHNLDVGKGVPPLHGKLQASFAKDMTCMGELLGIGDTPLEFQCTLPITLSPYEPFIAIDMNREMKGYSKAEGSLTPLLELFIMDASSFAADGAIALHMAGTPNDPQFDGKMALRNGLFEIYELGTIITGIEADLKVNGSYLEITRLKGSDGAGGQITGTGSMHLSHKEGFPFHWNIILEHAKPLQIDLLKGTASGNLSWKGTIEGSVVEGELEVLQGELSLPRKIPETAVTYPVRYINHEKASQKPTEIAQHSAVEIPIELKIHVTTSDPLIINDAELKSTWKGKINLLGNVQKPQIVGELKLDSGDYILNGKRFVLSQGRVSFNGDYEKKSNLFVSLSREIGGYDVEIILKGQLKDPEIMLLSHPALPKQQVLSLILFGRTSAEISELQEEQLEQSLSNLTTSSSKKEEGTLTKFQKSLGIDHIDFMRSKESSSDMCIRVSKYLTRGICLSVYRDVAEDINAVAIEAEIQKNIKAQIEAQDNAEGQVSIFWKKNY